jgi:hypothetical protein
MAVGGAGAVLPLPMVQPPEGAAAGLVVELSVVRWRQLNQSADDLRHFTSWLSHNMRCIFSPSFPLSRS